MKERAYCKKCEKDIKPDSEIKSSKLNKDDPCSNNDMISVGDSNVVCSTEYTCPDCKSVILEKDVTVTSFKFNECLIVANCLQNAINHKDIIGDVGYKIGDIKKCKECGKITDVVMYNGCLDYCSNTHSSCSACYDGISGKLEKECKSLESVAKEDRKWMKEVVESEKMYKEVYGVQTEIMSVSPPASDSVVELERVSEAVKTVIDGKYKFEEYELAVEDQFINKCAELGLISKDRYVQNTEQMSVEVDESKYESIVEVMDLVYKYIPPISDSVIERERIAWFVSELHTGKNKSMRDYDNLIKGRFLGTCETLNILSA